MKKVLLAIWALRDKYVFVIEWRHEVQFIYLDIDECYVSAWSHTEQAVRHAVQSSASKVI